MKYIHLLGAALAAMTAAAVVCAAGPAQALPIYTDTYTASGTCPDGPCSATATISLQSYNSGTGTAEFEVQLTDNLENPTSPGQLVSGVLISLSEPVPTGSSDVTLASQSGQLIDLESGGTYSDVSGSPDHWGAARTTSNCPVAGSCIALETAGDAAQGGAPVDMIIGPPDGSNLYSNANGGLNNGTFYPYIQGTGTFFVDVTGLAGLLPPELSGVTVAFGTGPDYYLKAPEPMTLSLFGAGLFGVANLAVLGRRKKKVA